MIFSDLAKAAAAVFIAGSLAGCVDMDMEVSVLGADEASVKIETVVSSEFISMADITSGDAEFCNENAEITEDKDAKTLTCVEVIKGSFAEVFPEGDDGEPQPTIETVSPGVVKVSFPTTSMTEDMTAQMGGGEEMEPQMMAMMGQMFAGHSITLRIKGKKITDTNMTLNEDGTTAELVVPFDELIDGSFSLEEDAYAVVDFN